MSEISTEAVIEMNGVGIASMQDSSSLTFMDVNWSVSSGEFWTVAGMEFSGKTDFLLLTAGLMAPVSGSYKLFGVETRTLGEAELPVRLRMGYVFAGGLLFNAMTVAENLALPLRYHTDFSEAEVVAQVEQVVAMFELGPFADLMPSEVPAAWRHRAAVARALMLKPEVLLLDNPLAGLVAKHRQWLVQFLDRLWRGHEWYGGRPITLAVTTDDLNPWKHPQRKFALLEEGKFIPLGNWREVEVSTHAPVKEMLAAPTLVTTLIN